jgi:hypothetical protein
MKKVLLIMAVTVIGLGLVACGEKQTPENNQEQNLTSNTESASNSSLENQTETQTGNQLSSTTTGTLTLSEKDLAIVVKGTSVPMPFKLKDLEAASVPADESRDGTQLGAGDIFSANLYLDENEDYLLIPAYQNKGESPISIVDAEAEEINMTTYADDPTDQGVSILGITFGMEKSEVKNLLGEPASDDSSYSEWHLEIPDMSYEGTLSMYFTSDTDDARVSQVVLNVFPK